MRLRFSILSAALLAPALGWTQSPAIVYDGEISVNSNADGGLRPAIGVHNIQVYRANRTASEHQDSLADTYTHAPMLAYWRGRFYLDYLSAPVNEHDPNTSTSYTTSADGVHWEPPRLLFPSYQLPDGEYTLNHQRASFYVAPNDRLLATAFYGHYPNPQDGTGIGRAVREIRENGELGPIYFIRYNQHPGWNSEEAAVYPHYTESDDVAFVEACEALLADKLMTAQWWEEDRSEDGFYRATGQALSYYRRADGKVAGIWKRAITRTTDDGGESWADAGVAALPINSAKYWVQRTSDGRYAIAFNPTSRLRHPLAVAVSQDGQRFSNLVVVHGELPVQRFPGKYKNMGPQYVRGIVEGNGTPPDDKLWLAYSVNKEDIWVSSVPVPIGSVRTFEEVEDFESYPGELPQAWNIYRPLWAPAQIVTVSAEQGKVLELSDEDPYDYSSATRVFEQSRSALIRFRLRPAQIDARLEIDLVSAAGLRPVQLAFTEDGKVEARHEGIWKPAGSYSANEWIDVEIDVNPGDDVDRFQFRINGEEVLFRAAYFTDLVSSVERLVFRTGAYRQRGSGGHELPDADEKAKRSAFWIDDVSIVANR